MTGKGKTSGDDAENKEGRKRGGHSFSTIEKIASRPAKEEGR